MIGKFEKTFDDEQNSWHLVIDLPTDGTPDTVSRLIIIATDKEREGVLVSVNHVTGYMSGGKIIGSNECLVSELISINAATRLLYPEVAIETTQRLVPRKG